MADDEKKAKPKAKAGWYPHPSMADTRRYWDGQKWTDNIAPMEKPKEVVSDRSVKAIAGTLALLFVVPAVLLTLIGPSYGVNECGSWLSPEFSGYEISLESRIAAAECEEKLNDRRAISLALLGVGLVIRLGAPRVIRAVRS